MSEQQYKEIFFNFLKDLCGIAGLQYSASPVEGQCVVRLLVNTPVNDTSEIPPHREVKKSVVVEDDYVILDFNYEALFENFIGIDYQERAVEWAIQKSRQVTTREEEAKMWLQYFIKPLFASNINTKTVYLVTSIDNSGWDSDIWDDTILVKETVEKLLGE